jgi:hypothetical protein
VHKNQTRSAATADGICHEIKSWTRDRVVEMTANPDGRDPITAYLHLRGAPVVTENLNGGCITAAASMLVWEKELQIFTFDQTYDLYMNIRCSDPYVVSVLATALEQRRSQLLYS